MTWFFIDSLAKNAKQELNIVVDTEYVYRILEEPHVCEYDGRRVVLTGDLAAGWSPHGHQLIRTGPGPAIRSADSYICPDVSNSVRPNTPNVSHINCLHLMRVHYVLLIPSVNLLRLHPRGQSDTYDNDKINGAGTYILTYLF